MNVLLLFLALIGMATFAAGQALPCCAPKEFTFHYEQALSAQNSDQPMVIALESVDGAYDFLNALVGMEVSARPVNGTEEKFKLIQNFTAGFQWIIQGSQCVKQSLNGSAVPMRCIPEGAMFDGTYVIGLKEQNVVHRWLITVDAPGPIKGTQIYTVTDYMCSPTSSTFIGTATTTESPETFVASGNYFNVTTTIKDRNRWFKLPSSCDNTVQDLSVLRLYTSTKTLHTHFF